MSAPSLHEIAAMSYPASMLAMRQHYNPDWHKPEPDGDLSTFKVKVTYSTRMQDSRTYTVEAASEEHARQLAEEAFDKDQTLEVGPLDDVDVDDVQIVEHAA